ncbi:hypothetical protein [Chitinophaga sp. S165]|uniref:hypothetical protein n=1 Tax=Chitinophaga sp. S165 TaxID=2135462 RepID=UPI000D71D5F8|nr:hypothetical protein [Chitinophaga sp. S165]PWV44453.1 hypothetical protein C7475_1222 [Chitinophaga sp. S165]
MCIYYTKRTDLTYGAGEHIISAGLGGIKKLPVDMVSQEFNNDISKYERWLLKNSILNATRQIIGPGSRGKMAERYESKSDIHLIENLDDNEDMTVGYIQKGKPRSLTALSYDSQRQTCSFNTRNYDGVDVNAVIDAFASAIECPSDLHIKTILDDRLPISKIYLGHQKGVDSRYDTFFFKHSGNSLEASSLPFVALADALRNGQLDSQEKDHKVRSHQTLNWREEYFRIFAKYCFNYLAQKKGKEFMLQVCFDPVREWIANGGANKFASFIEGGIPVPNDDLGIRWPKYGHIILLIPHGDVLYGFCSLYNGYTVKVLLSESVKDFGASDGFICDWLEKKEFELQHYLAIQASQFVSHRQTGKLER